jgi:hypothetical protein
MNPTVEAVTGFSETSPHKVSGAGVSEKRGARWNSLIALLLLGSLSVLVFQLDNPRRIVSAEAPASQFSSERALRHVAVLSRKPHPIGSEEHAKTLNYIVESLRAIGLTPEIQKTTVVSQTSGVAATVENVVARMQGSSGEKGLALVAHYDSVPVSFGASDDGAGVAVLLETARALQAIGQPGRTVYFLFTDGEEVGLLGAQAFVSENSWAHEIGTVLNFEARGNKGPAILFETSSHASSLVQAARQSEPSPVANSLSYEIYKRLPNDTDFTVFRKAGFAGLNFAFIDGLAYYHSALDNPSHLNRASLQQEGENALALTRRLSYSGTAESVGGDSVYFDLLSWRLIQYSPQTSLILVVAAALLLVALFWRARRSATLKQYWASAGLVLLAVIAAALVAGLAGWAMQMLGSQPGRIQAGMFYHSGAFVTGFSMLGVAAACFVCAWAGQRLNFRNLAMGGLLVWGLLLVLCAVLLPGATYLWLWPLLFMLLAQHFIFDQQKPWRLLLLGVAFLPAIIIVVPLLHKLFTAFAGTAAPVAAALAALLLALIPEYFYSGQKLSLRRLAGILCVLAAAVLAGGVLSSHYSPDTPLSDSLFYAVDADTGKQVWASSDPRPDVWTQQFLGKAYRREPMKAFFPEYERNFLQAPTSGEAPLAPEARIMEQTTGGEGVRVVRMRITSRRAAAILSLFIARETPVIKATVNGKLVPASRNSNGAWTLRYYALPTDGIDLELQLKTTGPVHMKLEDVSYGLPAIAAANPARPSDIVPAQLRFNDSTLVVHTVSF